MNKFNYQAWRELFETHCTNFGVLGHLDGTSVSTNETDKVWKQHNGLVKMWIYGTISKSILDTTRKQAINDLQVSHFVVVNDDNTTNPRLKIVVIIP